MVRNPLTACHAVNDCNTLRVSRLSRTASKKLIAYSLQSMFDFHHASFPITPLRCT